MGRWSEATAGALLFHILDKKNSRNLLKIEQIPAVFSLIDQPHGTLFFFLVDPRGIRTRVCANARYRSFTCPAQTMHIAVHGTAYAGVQLVWIQQKNNRVCDAHPVAFLVDPRGIALDFCEANAPNGERGASQKSSVTVLKRSTGAFSHWVQFPSLRE